MLTTTVTQKDIDTLLEAFRMGDNTAADTLWDLQEYMTSKQCTDTKAKIDKILAKREGSDHA